MKATIVFEQTWKAIHEKDEKGNRKYKYIIHTGSSRSSKTHSILQTHWLIALSKPNTRVSIWRETKADCKMTILADLKKAIPTFPNIQNVVFNKTESIYTFLNGSTIEFMGGDEENRVHGFQGNVAHLNEPYNFSLDAFNQIDMRTSDYIIIDWNPKSNHWIDSLIKQDNAIVIHSTFKDNPFCPPEQKKKILSYEPTEYNIQQNTASDYLWTVYGLGLKAEKPNRIFKNWQIISDSEFDSLPYNLYFGMDFGLSAPTTLVAMKFDGDQTFFFKELLYKPMNEMNGTLSDELHNLGIDKRIELICDSSNDINKTEGQKLRNSGFNVIFALKGKGSVISGIELLQKKIIYYTKSSINLEQEYENHSWRIVQGVQLDEPEQGNDHAIDAVKYVSSWYSRTRYLT